MKLLFYPKKYKRRKISFFKRRRKNSQIKDLQSFKLVPILKQKKTSQLL